MFNFRRNKVVTIDPITQTLIERVQLLERALRQLSADRHFHIGERTNEHYPLDYRPRITVKDVVLQLCDELGFELKAVKPPKYQAATEVQLRKKRFPND